MALQDLIYITGLPASISSAVCETCGKPVSEPQQCGYCSTLASSRAQGDQGGVGAPPMGTTAPGRHPRACATTHVRVGGRFARHLRQRRVERSLPAARAPRGATATPHRGRTAGPPAAAAGEGGSQRWRMLPQYDHLAPGDRRHLLRYVPHMQPPVCFALLTAS